MSDEAPPPPPPPQDAATAGTSARPSHRLRRSAAVIAGVAVVAAGVVVGVVLTRPHGAQSAAVTAGVSEPRLTIPETIMAAHGDENGVLDFEGALELFSYAYTPLPGVILPAGAPDVPAHWVSQAAEAISTHLGELTPAQRAVVLMYFQDVTGSGSPIQAAPAAVHSGVTADLMGLTPATYVRQDIANLVAKAFSDEAAKLGHTIGDAPANTSLAHVYLYLTQKAM
ncbi:MAG: hypothetical protein JOZ75_07455, partial [Candidatus Dormibacteraeota bacterium]|nr:hypothetical protein [Candidatus Dormibacteraeota bacterium]